MSKTPKPERKIAKRIQTDIRQVFPKPKGGITK